MRRVDMPCTLKTKTQDFTTRTDSGLFCDSTTELAARMAAGCKDEMWGTDWTGGLTKAAAPALLENGDESRVAASDAFLSKLEGKFEFISSRFRTVSAIAGGAANVGAYLAGSPLAMRRRHRVSDDMAPLTIVADCSSSSGISGDKMERRGAAILALVRLLATRRPVNLWAGVQAGNVNSGILALMTRIETAPLDLARAAFMLSHQGASRGIGYGVSRDEFKVSTLGWSFGSEQLERSYSHEFYGRVFPGTEILFIPAAYLTDKSIADPEAWLTEMLAKFGGLDEEAR